MEQRENAKQEEANGVSSQTDVASILARRVAVEMSDSDNENASDSEYDSDDWGDESTAWHKSKLLKQQKEYFFKSQESLATVIDNEEDEETEIENQITPETERISNTPPENLVKTAVTEDKFEVKNSGNNPDFSSTITASSPGENPTTSWNNLAASGKNLAASSRNITAVSENSRTDSEEQPLGTTKKEVLTTASKKTTNV